MKKAMPWFRFYTEVLDDPKVQRLPPHLFKTWVNLLCLAGTNSGSFPTVDDIAFRLRMSTHDVEQQMDELILAGLIDIERGGKRTPHNWSQRQFVSDSSTERVRKFRNKSQEQARNGDETLHETPPDSDPYPETDTKTKPLPSEQSPAREKVDAMDFVKVGMGKGGSPSHEARRKVAGKLGIATADPLVPLYEAWPQSRFARDADALFIVTAPKLLREASPEVKAACQPAPEPITARPVPKASSALRASLARVR